MKLKLAIVFSAAGLLLSITEAQAIPVSGSDRGIAIQSEAVTIGCVGGRRCSGGYHYRHGVRVCRAWIACR